jgi:3-hydroxy-9,10-secoandrosta-1,3,5(10)-triene-9,17-dione monooxygenase
MNVAARPADTRNAEALIERARSLIPALRQRSAQTQSLRKLPDETVADYKRLELTRCLQPAMFGGYGSD